MIILHTKIKIKTGDSTGKEAIPKENHKRRNSNKSQYFFKSY